MLTVRLKRVGRKKKPFYNIVVMEKSFYINGKYVENLGYFDPIKKNSNTYLNMDRINFWIKNGATVSKKIKFLMKNYEDEKI